MSPCAQQPLCGSGLWDYGQSAWPPQPGIGTSGSQVGLGSSGGHPPRPGSELQGDLLDAFTHTSTPQPLDPPPASSEQAPSLLTLGLVPTHSPAPWDPEVVWDPEECGNTVGRREPA